MDIDTLYSLFCANPQISTDTRNIQVGSIFFALKGEHFDGNAFAYDALRQGAAYAVVSDPSLSGDQIIYVDDTLAALQSLATHHRRQFNGPVLAITGSNGKTTTKELVTSVLNIQYKVHATKGNLNNHIGVPITLLGIQKETEFVVCEMGANHPGEIAALCTIAEPTHGLITNIGKAHLEGFGSIEGVQKAKGELFDYLNSHGGLCFINTDDPRLVNLGQSIPRKITYGFNPSQSPQVLFRYTASPGSTGFIMHDTQSKLEFHTSMFGQYNASNMLAAFTIGQHFEIEEQKMADVLARFSSGANRSEVIQWHGCTVVKDAYNANPSSMELALRAYHEQYPQGWIILGDMKELGADADAAHQHIYALALQMPFERMYFVGPTFSKVIHSAMDTPQNVTTAKDIEEVRDQWSWEDIKGSAVLLKGSRSMHLERLLENGGAL